MPVISRLALRSTKGRLVVAAMYAVLLLGAATMVYPFLLMLSGSCKSVADASYQRPIPPFWLDDVALFQKYAESKHNADLGELQRSWGKTVRSWLTISPPSEHEKKYLAEFLEWRGQCPWWDLGHARGTGMLPINARLFRQRMYERFNGDIDAYRRAVNLPVGSWNGVMPPFPAPGRYPPVPDALRTAFNEFAAERPVEDRILPNLDQLFRIFLMGRYSPDIAAYNASHGTRHEGYEQVFLDSRVPRQPPQREDWETFVRDVLHVRFVHLDKALEPGYRQHLAKLHADIGQLNRRYGTAYASFDEVPMPATVPPLRLAALDWAAFLRDRQLCPADSMRIVGPRQLFEQFVAARRGVPVEQISPIAMPVCAADWHDCMARASELRREFTTRNYKHVLSYILVHGRGLRNTAILCALAVATALLVNPLAAYALSRYRLPSTYKILLFCMATMAFPGEVSMIPGFLLLRNFPLWPLAGGITAFALTLWILSRACEHWPETLRMTAALAAGIIAGVWLVPAIIGRPHVSLLNTFAALVLPGMANGFSIFLLKGFFDSLPRELYESADIDGAGEWTKFWVITMSLSKPILAVIALNAFTGAYSAFMMALIIIPDPQMWTLMVWLYQLQTQSHQGVMYASLVIAALPMLVVFVLAQRVIIRAVIVPVEK